MKLVALLIAAMFAAITPAQSIPHAAPGMTVESRTLANGLRVSVIEDHAAAVVQTAMWYRFGSLDETPGKTGLAHALEHMMFRGTRAISGGGLDEIGARLGAVVNASTTEDYTHFYFTLPADRLDLAVHIEADRMRGLLLRGADWSLEKGAVLAEADGDTSQPMYTLAQRVREAAYVGSPFARNALGIRADVVRATATDLRRYYDTYYRPNNATLVVTGDVKPADVFVAAQRYFGAIPSKPIVARNPFPRPPTATAHVALQADYPYALVDCAYRIPGDLDADAAATQTFATIVNNTRSLFYRELVLSRLTLGYTAYADTALHAGIFHVIAYVRPGVAPQRVRHALETTLAKTLETGIDPQLLRAAKIAGLRQGTYSRDSISGLADRYGYALGIEGHDPADDDDALDRLDAAGMDVALRRYFRRTAVVGTLTPRRITAHDAPRIPVGVTDNFSNRTPSGPITLAAWAQAGVDRPLALASGIDPHVYRFANGLRLYVQEVHANPTVFVSGTVDVSPADDPPAKTGLGAIAASLLQYGGRTYDYAAQQRLIDELGADVNFGFQFGAHGLTRDFDRLVDLLADAERHPAFPARYLALVRDAESASIAQRDTGPDARAERAFLHSIYAPGDPILRQESTASLRAITAGDLRRYAARYIRPDRTTIVVAGDVDPAAVRATIGRAFGDWQNVGSVRAVAQPPLPPTRASVHYIATARDTVSVRLGERAIGRRDPDFYAFDLLNSVLGADGTFDTRLMHDIREQRGLVYDISSALSQTRDRGTLEISFNAAPHNVRAAVALVAANLERLRTQPVSLRELRRARTKIVAGTLVSEEATQALVAGCEFIARDRHRPDYYRTFAARYDRYTPRDLLRVARKYIHPADLVQVYEGPPPARDYSAAMRRKPSANASSGATKLSRSQPSSVEPKIRPGIATTSR